jgi:hypothetical protein
MPTLTTSERKTITLIRTLTMALLLSMKQLHLFLLSVALLISYQQPIAIEHIKSATESSMSMVDSDTAHINNEVELSASEQGLTIE